MHLRLHYFQSNCPDFYPQIGSHGYHKTAKPALEILADWRFSGPTGSQSNETDKIICVLAERHQIINVKIKRILFEVVPTFFFKCIQKNAGFPEGKTQKAIRAKLL